MAIYHCSVQIIKRSEGRSAVAAIAYRSASCLKCEYDGVTSDFTQKRWVTYSEIMLCDHAPPEFLDRSTLWNSVELAEKNSNAQLAREVQVALPKELTQEEHIEILQEFIQTNFISKGMCADYSIHNPPVTNDRRQPIDENGNVTQELSQMTFQNPHAHILLTMRPIAPDGEWEAKSQIVYLCKKDNIEKAFTASDYKAHQNEGWEKQYLYQVGKSKLWLTPSETQGKECTRIRKQPKTCAGNLNPTVEYWNSKERILEWRQSWEQIVNAKFISLNQDIRIDSRSYIEQGRTDEIPTLRASMSATNMDKRAMRLLREGKSLSEVQFSEIFYINQMIKEHNRLVRSIKEALETLYAEAKSTLKTIASKLESLRVQIIGNTYQDFILKKQHNQFKSLLSIEADKLTKNKSTSTPEFEGQTKNIKRLETTLLQLEEKMDKTFQDYQIEKSSVPEEEQNTLFEYQVAIRSQAEDVVKKKLLEHYGESFDNDTFKKSVSKTDSRLNSIEQHKLNSQKLLHEEDSLKRERHVRR